MQFTADEFLYFCFFLIKIRIFFFIFVLNFFFHFELKQVLNGLVVLQKNKFHQGFGPGCHSYVRSDRVLSRSGLSQFTGQELSGLVRIYWKKPVKNRTGSVPSKDPNRPVIFNTLTGNGALLLVSQLQLVEFGCFLEWSFHFFFC